MDRYVLIHHKSWRYFDNGDDDLEETEYLEATDDWLYAVKAASKSDTIIVDLQNKETFCCESPAVKKTYQEFEWWMIDTSKWSIGLKWIEGHPKILRFLYKHHPNLLTASSRIFFKALETTR